MPGSVIKLGPRADANKVSSHSSGWQSVCLTVLADQSGSTMLPALLSALLLLLAGDVETNPGPGRKKEPTAKEIQEAKIASHDEKIEALEKIVKEQKKMLAEMTEKQVELQTTIEEQKVEFTKSLEDKKVLDTSLLETKQAVKECFEKQVFFIGLKLYK